MIDSIRLPKEIEEKFHLKLTDRTMMDSYIHGCVFYSIEGYSDVFLTNYNIHNERPMPKDTWLLFGIFASCSKEFFGKKITKSVTMSEEYIFDQGVSDMINSMTYDYGEASW